MPLFHPEPPRPLACWRPLLPGGATLAAAARATIELARSFAVAASVAAFFLTAVTLLLDRVEVEAEVEAEAEAEAEGALRLSSRATRPGSGGTRERAAVQGEGQRGEKV